MSHLGILWLVASSGFAYLAQGLRKDEESADIIDLFDSGLDADVDAASQDVLSQEILTQAAAKDAHDHESQNSNLTQNSLDALALDAQGVHASQGVKFTANNRDDVYDELLVNTSMVNSATNATAVFPQLVLAWRIADIGLNGKSAAGDIFANVGEPQDLISKRASALEQLSEIEAESDREPDEKTVEKILLEDQWTVVKDFDKEMSALVKKCSDGLNRNWFQHAGNAVAEKVAATQQASDLDEESPGGLETLGEGGSPRVETPEKNQFLSDDEGSEAISLLREVAEAYHANVRQVATDFICPLLPAELTKQLRILWENVQLWESHGKKWIDKKASVFSKFLGTVPEECTWSSHHALNAPPPVKPAAKPGSKLEREQMKAQERMVQQQQQLFSQFEAQDSGDDNFASADAAVKRAATLLSFLLEDCPDIEWPQWIQATALPQAVSQSEAYNLAHLPQPQASASHKAHLWHMVKCTPELQQVVEKRIAAQDAQRRAEYLKESLKENPIIGPIMSHPSVLGATLEGTIDFLAGSGLVAGPAAAAGAAAVSLGPLGAIPAAVVAGIAWIQSIFYFVHRITTRTYLRQNCLNIANAFKASSDQSGV